MFNHALLAATGVGVVVAIVAVLIVFMLLLVIMTRSKPVRRIKCWSSTVR